MSETPSSWKRKRSEETMLSKHVLESVQGVTPLQVQLLANRDIDFATMRNWLAAEPACPADPFGLPQMAVAVSLIETALEHGERIAVIGDCDVDGLTATAIMVEVLQHLGARDILAIVMPRSEDGRGLTSHTTKMVIDSAPPCKLCITVDNGSSSRAEVALLREAGISTIITDHHHTDEPPEADAFINPQRADSTYANSHISGAGVALQLARALCNDTDLQTSTIVRLLDLAGMGTLADVVLLTEENHGLVARGLARINAEPRPGILALLNLAHKHPPINARDISFAIGPRINAAGRMDDPQVALDLLLTHDAATATALASKLDGVNKQRQDAMETMLIDAKQQAQSQIDDPLIFVEGDDWSLGIVGLVAGRLADEYHKLAVAVAKAPDGTCRGSLRTPRGFNVAEALGAIIPPLKDSGGHAQAGGFATTVDQLASLRAQLTAAYSAYLQGAATASTPQYEVDLVLPLMAITWERVKMVRDLEPFGQGFPQPLFVTVGVVLRDCTLVNQTHLRVTAATVEGSIPQQRTFFWGKGADQFARVTALRDGANSVDILWQMPQYSESRRFPEPYVVDIVPSRQG